LVLAFQRKVASKFLYKRVIASLPTGHNAKRWGLRGEKVNALKLKPAYNYLGVATGCGGCDNQPIPGQKQVTDRD
jgi:hypothetical protein